MSVGLRNDASLTGTSQQEPSGPCLAGFGNAIKRFAQFTILAAFSRMSRGYMQLTLPDGTVRSFGDKAHSLKAAIQINRLCFFDKCLWFGDIGFAESYMDGDWEAEDLTSVVSWFILNAEASSVLKDSSLKHPMINALGFYNRAMTDWRSNTVKMSKKNIREHYDLGNAFFQLFLDPSMTYSSAYFLSPDQSLQSAQEAKYERLCRKLFIEKQDEVLEIGCGWGGFAIYAASKYGCRVKGITISKEQCDYARRRVIESGLANLVEIELVDYRCVRGKFDKIVSIEMVEALGERFVETFFSRIDRLLKPEGLLAIQMINSPDCKYKFLTKNADFIQRYIFPGSLLLSIGRVHEAMAKTSNLFLHDLEDIGQFYARTLKRWRLNFESELEAVKELGFDERFIRKWQYYFCYCEAAFKMHHISTVQTIWSRPNNYFLAGIKP